MNNLFILGSLALAFVACQPREQPGAKLAAQHCQSCHQLPKPQSLPQHVWLKVLPNMALYMGWHQRADRQGYEPMPAELYANLKHLGTVPAQPKITEQEWGYIMRYYYEKSPVEFAQVQPQDIAPSVVNFLPINVKLPVRAPSTLLLKGEPGRLGFWLYNADSQQLHWLDDNLQARDSVQVGFYTVGLTPTDSTRQHYLLTGMGNFLPSDATSGFVYGLDRQPATGRLLPVKKVKLIDSLHRPVHTEVADLNQDGRSDLIICEFGGGLGRLSWQEQMADGNYQRHVLDDQAGACKSVATDWDQDGDIDVIAIFGQGREGVFYYQNEGKGQFIAVPWLIFPPTHGSNYFELADFNNDGKLDILCSNGDNADYPTYPADLRPYHGVRIFLNQGEDRFEEKFFFPLNGAGKIMAHDFDQDGDLDLAAIAYFPDYDGSPGESFVYLENQGQLNFQPQTFADSQRGHWLVMDLADYDRDGDMDILLGSVLVGLPVAPPALMERWEREKIPAVVLQNQLKSNLPK